jgi:hypothetical protein
MPWDVLTVVLLVIQSVTEVVYDVAYLNRKSNGSSLFG